MKYLAAHPKQAGGAWHFRLGALAIGIAVAACGQPLQAATWQVSDDWGLTTNTTLSLGTSWSL